MFIKHLSFNIYEGNYLEVCNLFQVFFTQVWNQNIKLKEKK